MNVTSTFCGFLQAQALSELTDLIENACAPIIRVDRELKVTLWNQHTVVVTGFSKDEALGQNLVEKFIDEDSQASVREVLRKVELIS